MPADIFESHDRSERHERLGEGAVILRRLALRYEAAVVAALETSSRLRRSGTW